MNLFARCRRFVVTSAPALAGLLAAAEPALGTTGFDAVVCVNEASRYEVRDDGEEAKLRVAERYAVNRLGRESDRLRYVTLPSSFPFEPHKTRVKVWNADGLRMRYDQNHFQDRARQSQAFVSDALPNPSVPATAYGTASAHR